MRILKDLRRRGLALFLVLTMCLGMIPGTAFAAERTQGARTASVTGTRYPSLNRDSVEINYRLNREPSGVHLVVLWDKTAGNPAAVAMSSLLNRYSWLCMESRTQADSISYSSFVSVFEHELTGKYEGTLGEGQSNEAAALDAALTQVEPGTVVLWVPSINLDDRRTDSEKVAILEKLEALKKKIGPTGTLAIRQMADQASALLGSDVKAIPADSFAKSVEDWLEKVLTDYIENYTLTFSPTGELGRSVTGVTSNLGTVTDNKNGTFTLSIPKLYDHEDLYVTVTVALQKINPKSIVDVVAVNADKGTHYSGLEDTETDHDLPAFPNGTADRVLREITFKGGSNTSFQKIEPLKALPGQLVVLPDVSDQNAPGAAFAWWMSDSAHYKPGRVLAMPEYGITLTAQWGHVEVELHVDDVTVLEPVGNRMASYKGSGFPLLSFNKSIFAIEDSQISSIRFETKGVEYTASDKNKNFGKVKGPNGEEYPAKFVGATPQDNVVAYLVNTQETLKYEMRIAGEGGVTAPKNCYGLFDCWTFSTLDTVDLTHLDTTNTTSMNSMFSGCKAKSLILPESFDTSNVTDMSSMFKGCSGLTTLDMSKFNTSNVTDMSYMFRECVGLTTLDVSKFDTSNVTDMSNMFFNCWGLPSLDVSKFNTSNVTNMSYMFNGCRNLPSLDVSKFNTSNVTDMSYMFNGCQKLPSLDVSNFDTSNVTDMSNMFNTCSGLTSLDVSKFNTSNVTNMSYMFNYCRKLTSLDVSNFDTSNVTNMSYMFCDCWGLPSLNVSKFNTSNVTNMSYMFCNCWDLPSLDVSKFNTSNVTNMKKMFTSCQHLSSLDVSNFDTSNVTDMSCMFQDFGSRGGLTSLDVSKFDTSNVMNMSRMFSLCTSLTSLDLSRFSTSKVTDMSYMFDGCISLSSLELSSFDTSKVTDMSGMFSRCRKLTSLDLSKFNTSNVTNMSGMFIECSGLTALDLSKFDTSNVEDMRNMFSYCKKLSDLNLSGFNTSNVTYMTAMFEMCAALPSLDLSSFDTSKAYIESMFKDCSSLETILFVNQNGEGNFYLKDGGKWANLFAGCSQLKTLEGLRLDTKDVSGLFSGRSSLQRITFLPPKDGVEKEITSLFRMFANCYNLTYVDMHGWNMPALSSVSYMFENCPNLTYVDMRGWNMPELSNVTYMFSCSGAEMADLTINMSWSGLKTTNQIQTTGIANGRNRPVNLIVGETYNPNGTDACSKVMTQIIKAFPAGSKAYKTGTYNSETGKWDFGEQVYPVSTYTTNPDPLTYTVETWLDDQTEAAKTKTVEYTAADVTFTDDGDTTATACAIPTVEGYDFAYALFGESAEHLPVEDMTVTFPVTGDPETDVLKLYYTAAVDETPKTVQYTVAYCVDGEIDDSLTETIEVKDGEEVTAYTDKCPDGYRLDEEQSTKLPFTVEDGKENVIEVYYVKDAPVTAAYTMYTWYGKEKTETTETGIVTDGTVIYVVPAAKEGYHFDYAVPEAEELPEGGWTVTLPISEPPMENIISVYYAADIQEDKTDNATPPESVPEPDPEGAENEELKSPEGREALSLTRTNRRMANENEALPQNGDHHYTEQELLGEDVDLATVYKQPKVTAVVPTPMGSTLTYKVVVKYTGDSGVQSGQIDIRYPLPDGVAAEAGAKLRFGGSDYKQPGFTCNENEFKLENGVLKGTISGLHAGKTFEVSINCVLAELNPEVEDGYHYWDGTAYAQMSSEAVSSNIMRLWWKETAGPDNPNPPDPDGNVVVRYQFAGKRPAGVDVPESVTVKAGTSVMLPTVNVPRGYTFDGWYKLDGDGTKIEMGKGYPTTNDDIAAGVTFYGTWKIDQTKAEFVTIKYDLGENAPEGASLPTSEFKVQRGDIHNVIEMAKDVVPNYDFNGWMLESGELAGLTINTSEYKANDKIVLTGSWTAHKGTIVFDANGGDGSMESQTITLAKPESLNKNAYEDGRQHITWANHKFLGWATSKDNANAGTVEYNDGASAASLVDLLKAKEDKKVTLYAVWMEMQPELSIRKVVKLGSSALPKGEKVTVGDTLTYEVTVQNSGSGDAADIKLDDYFAAHEGAGVTWTSDDPTERAFNVKAGSTKTFTATYEVVVADKGKTITNSAVFDGMEKPDAPQTEVKVPDGPDDPDLDPSYTVTYTDGVAGEEVFADQVTPDLKEGVDTPPFVGTPTREGWTFRGWDPVVAEKVTSNAIYTAQWERSETPPVPHRVIYQWSGAPNSTTLPVDSTAYTENDQVTVSTAYRQDQTIRQGRYTYTFSGWYMDEALTERAGTSFTMPDHNVTLYGSWTRVRDDDPYEPDDPTPPTPTPDPDPEPEPQPEPEPEPEPTPPPLLERPVDPGTGMVPYDPTVLLDDLVPLAAPHLNVTDHYAYIIGYPDGMVKPLGSITRAEVATVFFRLMLDEYRQENWATENDFPDVTADKWYNNAVSTCAKAGIIKGYPDGTFRPNATITRAEFAAIAARFVSDDVPGYDYFTDMDGHWAQIDVARAVMAGWIKGEGRLFRPNDRMTRAETATLVNRMINRFPDKEHLLEDMIIWPDNPQPPMEKWFYEDIQEATNSHDYEAGDFTFAEVWTYLLANRDWAALETEWANATAAPGGEVAPDLQPGSSENSQGEEPDLSELLPGLMG